MGFLRGFALLVRFLAELAMFGALGIGGWVLATGSGWWVLAPVLAVVLPVATMTAWAVFLSPQRLIDSPRILRIAVEALLFAAAGYLMGLAGEQVFGVALFATWAVDRLVLAFVDPEGDRWRRPDAKHGPDEF